MIIAVDFDDTLFEYQKTNEKDFSGRLDSIGNPIPHTIEMVKGFRSQGHKLILWTCREGLALDHAISACKSVGIVFDAVNSNIREGDEGLYWPDCRKIKADFYIDDRAVNPFGNLQLPPAGSP